LVAAKTTACLLERYAQLLRHLIYNQTEPTMKTIILLFSSVSILLCQQSSDGGLHFDFTSDVRLFTAYAFMNAAGNDAEWRPAGMHPLRIAVRKELGGRLDSTFLKRIRDFHFSHGGSWSVYGFFALITSGPPDFQVSFDSSTSDEDCKNIEKAYAGLSDLLAEFYKKANIAQLWEKYQPLIQAENDRFKPFAPSALDDIESYCRLKKGFFAETSSRIHFQFCPLMLYFTGQTIKVNGEIWIIAGPQEGEPDESSFYHEALHHVISPLTATIDSTTAKRFADLFELAKSTTHLGYSYFDESFVRTLDYVIGGKRHGRPDSAIAAGLTHEYKFGFPLCLAILEQLKHYEASSMTFAEYFPIIIANIDVDREKRRWLELNNKSP
jgi:hypothetical protein